jgi:predicted Zn-dependent peptidase
LTIQGIRSTQEQPFAIAQQQLRRSLYQDHPYALPTLGVEETVSTLDQAALRHYHQTYFRPDNLVVSVMGCIDPDTAIGLIDRVLGDWQIPTQADGTMRPLPELHLPTIAPRPHAVTTPQDTHQAIVMLGYLAAPVKDPDYAALKLLNTYLSNGLSSRLFVELREKQGLAYEVSGFYPTRLEMSQFVVYMGTAPGNTAIAVQGLKHEIDRLCTTRLTPEELQATKSKLLGQYALGKQTNAQIAQLLGWYEILELGLEFDALFQEAIVAVTAEDAQQAAERYFIDPYISLVGPEAAIDRALQAVS